jgi:hypothetical protein
MGRRSAPEVNAGSMADIAFLLLIFFLVTTTIETDSGINRKLPPMEEIIDPPIIKERNIFTVVVNKNNQILVEEKLMELRNLRSEAVSFLDNGGGLAEEACNYCQGSKDRSSSDNPDKAIISLKNDRETDYKVYISVQNELVAAYNQLRNREFTRLYPEENMSYIEADKMYTDPRTEKSVKAKLKEKISVIKLMYPMKLSEAEPNKTS